MAANNNLRPGQKLAKTKPGTTRRGNPKGTNRGGGGSRMDPISLHNKFHSLRTRENSFQKAIDKYKDWSKECGLSNETEEDVIIGIIHGCPGFGQADYDITRKDQLTAYKLLHDHSYQMAKLEIDARRYNVIKDKDEPEKEEVKPPPALKLPKKHTDEEAAGLKIVNE